MRWYWKQYLGDRCPENGPLAAILRFPDLTGHPPATVLTAEFDPLRNEGDAYARRLVDAGVSVCRAEAPGMIHGFFGMTGVVPDAVAWVSRVAPDIAEKFA